MTNKEIKYIIIACVIISYGIYMVYSQLSHNEIDKNGKYTIAKVTDFKTNFRNGYTVYYQYKVMDKVYNEKMHISKDYNNIINHIFFAKYNPEKPEHCFIMLDRPALSKFGDAPPNGWDKIPN